jgi:outer membrane protein TolC
LGALFAAFGAVRSAAAEQLSIEDVARLTLQNLPEMQQARESATASSEASKSVGGRLLPSVHVMDEYQHWDSPFIIPQFAAFGALRDQNTNTFVASARQPLLGLLHGTESYKASSTQADAAAANVKVNESDVRVSVELSYLDLFRAKERAEIAKASADELATEVAETQARVKAGTLTNSDLLRIQVAEASARQDIIVADADATVLRATILSNLGRSPDDTTTEFLPPNDLLAQVDVPASAGTDALSRRPEMQVAKYHADAASHDERARGYQLLPEIDLEGAYVRTDGQVFAPKNSAYVGVKADWAIWEWGAKNSARKAAAAEARIAALGVEATKQRVLREVTQRKAQLGAAVSAVALARQNIASAEEAYRVTEVQVRAGTSTTTDLLTAEAALTQARVRLENSRYALAAARLLLERALGLR